MVAEFIFELQVCQWAERYWPPLGDASQVLVARQLGTKRRRWDTVVIECDHQGLVDRARFGETHLDSDLLQVVRHTPEDWAWYQDVLPEPDYPWRYVREAVHRAADRGILETRRAGNHIQIRRKWPYPQWVDRIIAIENKPDLDASAASDLNPQLQRDVALGLADEVWVATVSSDDQIQPILFKEMPVKAGIITLTPDEPGEDAATVTWRPRRLCVDEPGTRILDRSSSEPPNPVSRFEYVDPEWKTIKRLEIAERAYERGWRSYIDSMRPDCRYFQLEPRKPVARPYCVAKARNQTGAECSGSCPKFEPEPPTWRQFGWPIEGGPGAGIKRILHKQRRRTRPDP